MTVRVKVMACSYNASLLLLGWFLQCTLIVRPHPLMIPTTVAIQLKPVELV